RLVAVVDLDDVQAPRPELTTQDLRRLGDLVLVDVAPVRLPRAPARDDVRLGAAFPRREVPKAEVLAVVVRADVDVEGTRGELDGDRGDRPAALVRDLVLEPAPGRAVEVDEEILLHVVEPVDPRQE